MADTKFRFTIPLLQEYSSAALANAEELAQEALLLLSNGHSARAYFLGVASIEETGKAIIAFDGQGRNLRDSSVTAKLRRNMEDHSQKITSAFIPMVLEIPNLRDSLMPIVHLMIHIKRGREPSMYTDIQYEAAKIQTPAAVVRNVAAQDCVRLAEDCLRAARKHMSESTPQIRSRADDELFAMKSDHFQKLLNTEGFWWYYIAQLETGNQDFSASVIAYQRDFLSKGKTYQRSS